MQPISLLLALSACVLSVPVTAADTPSPKPADKANAAPARPLDPLGNLKPYEERRYRIDLQDCDKQSGADRRVCERTVRNKAAAKSRRRAAAGH